MEEFELIHCRVDLHKSNYKQIKNAELLRDPPVDTLLSIYEDYCKYNKFKSFMPIFPSEFLILSNLKKRIIKIFQSFNTKI